MIDCQASINVEHRVIIGLEKILRQKIIVGISGQVQRHYEDVHLIRHTGSEIIVNWHVRNVVSSFLLTVLHHPCTHLLAFILFIEQSNYFKILYFK